MSFVSRAQGQGLAGYASLAYAKTLTHLGSPLELPGSGTSLIAREIPGTSHQDLCAPYPLLCCRNWSALAEELATLEGYVSLMAVLDPLAAPSEEVVRDSFPDRLTPFKRHHLVDLTGDLEAERASQHRRKVRKALRHVQVERVDQPAQHGEEWLGLYSDLRERHGFSSAPSDFTQQGLQEQLALPGLVYYRAILEGECVAAYLFLQQGEDVFYHLGASNSAGRDVGASYALVDAAIREAAQAGLSQLDLGSTASLEYDPTNGLDRFKRGWATHSAVAYIGGRIMDREIYGELSTAAGETRFFPAYRAPRSGAGASG